MSVPTPRILPPWTRRDGVAISVTNAVAAVVLLAGAGALGADSSTSTAITWLNVGVIAVVAAAVGDLWWIAAGRRELLDRRRAICADLRPIDAGDVSGVPHAAWVHVEGMTRAHRADCILVAGKGTQPVDSTTARHGFLPLRRCEVCAP